MRWLGAGAITLGMAGALLGGAAIAAADTGSASGGDTAAHSAPASGSGGAENATGPHTPASDSAQSARTHETGDGNLTGGRGVAAGSAAGPSRVPSSPSSHTSTTASEKTVHATGTTAATAKDAAPGDALGSTSTGQPAAKTPPASVGTTNVRDSDVAPSSSDTVDAEAVAAHPAATLSSAAAKTPTFTASSAIADHYVAPEGEYSPASSPAPGPATGVTASGNSKPASDDVSGTTVSSTPPSHLSLVSASSDHGQSAVPPAATLQSLVAGFLDQVQYVFFNQAPSITVPTEVSSGAGVVTGTVVATTGNAHQLTYTVTVAPKYGDVEVDARTGAYTYTPIAALVKPGITDEFTVSVDNGASLRLDGLAGVVQQALHAVAYRLGWSSGDTATATLTVTATGTGVYGDAKKNKQYWQEQSYSDCALVATANVVGQLTGRLPSESDILLRASTTTGASGKPIWAGNDQQGSDMEDSVILLKTYGIDSTLHKYAEDDGDSTFTEGQEALRDIESALAQGNAVMAGVNAGTLWTAATYNGPAQNLTESDHAVVVIGINTVTGKVVLNDSGADDGQAMEVSLGAFLWAWNAASFETIIAVKPTTSTAAVPLLVAA